MPTQLKTTLKHDAVVIWTRTTLRHPSQGFNYPEFNYKVALEQLVKLQETTGGFYVLPQSMCNRGIVDYEYLIAGELIVNKFGKPFKSPLIGVHGGLINAIVEVPEIVNVPYSADHPQFKRFLDKEGLYTARVLTPWVDGFTLLLK